MLWAAFTLYVCLLLASGIEQSFFALVSTAGREKLTFITAFRTGSWPVAATTPAFMPVLLGGFRVFC